jgi:hypothetical protein
VCCLSEAEHDALAAAIWQREQEALANLPAGLSELPTDTFTAASEHGWCVRIEGTAQRPVLRHYRSLNKPLNTPENVVLWPG